MLGHRLRREAAKLMRTPKIVSAILIAGSATGLVSASSDTRSHHLYKDEIRNRIIKSAQNWQISAAPLHRGEVEAFLGRDRIERSLPRMDTGRLKSGIVTHLPWSDSYWPTHQGLVGARYADPQFPRALDWLRNFTYVTERQSPVNHLSPAEKYDMLTGNPARALTRWSWDQGEYYYRKYGKVDDWMGLCHGWAAAAHMLVPVRRTPVDAVSPDGTQIRFFPSDIRGLLSLLWAEASPPARFIGGRCRTPNPKRDRNGRIIDERCFDANPGSWHLAIVNRIGLEGMSLVVDAMFDEEVWNYPVISYNYAYFNPRTLRPSGDLTRATIERQDFRNDPFEGYRDQNTRYITGISMDVSFAAPTKPHHGTPGRPAVKTLNYRYDLELDSDFRIIGGEWHQVDHPDFLWTFERSARAVSDAEQSRPLNGDWQLEEPLPKSWRSNAAQAAKDGQPLARIIDELVRAP